MNTGLTAIAAALALLPCTCLLYTSVERAERATSGERRERRPRREDADYDLPPVQQSTTSLADLFSGFKPMDE